jgi:uncharacterized membrane protein
MRRFFTSPLLAVVIVALPFLYLGTQYSSLPDTVPVHFNAEGVADGFGSKSSLWLHTCILSVIAISIYLLISNLHKIDPKKTAKTSASTLHLIAIVMVLFLSVINISITYSAVSYPTTFSLTKIVLFAVGLLLSFIGYQMRTIQPNYFIGLRLPWTLEDDDNWKATHRLAAQLWVPGGLIIAIIAWVLPFFSAFITTIIITAIMVIIPTIFSYRFFRKKQA